MLKLKGSGLLSLDLQWSSSFTVAVMVLTGWRRALWKHELLVGDDNKKARTGWVDEKHRRLSVDASSSFSSGLGCGRRGWVDGATKVCRCRAVENDAVRPQFRHAGVLTLASIIYRKSSISIERRPSSRLQTSDGQGTETMVLLPRARKKTLQFISVSSYPQVEKESYSLG